MDPEFKAQAGLLGHLLEFNENLINRFDPNAQRRFFPTDELPWTKTLEQAYPDIRRELDHLLERRAAIPGFEKISQMQAALSNDERWRTYFLQVYGWTIPKSRQQCPRTWEALRQVPGMSLAMFSILEPGKRLRPHMGPHKGVLRYHLGLKVPSTDPARCGIRVGEELRGWAEGQSLLFDDTALHEAWNETDEERVVLFIDVPRPLPRGLYAFNQAIYGAARYLSPQVHEIRVKAQRYAAAMPD